MSFKRLDPEDFVVSSDSITAACWTDNNPTLTEFDTLPDQTSGPSGEYYINVYQTSSGEVSAEVQFAIAYGNQYGSGSSFYNNIAPDYSPTKTIYGQYRSLVLGDENSVFTFGGTTSNDFFAISIERSRYKEAIFPGSLNLTLTNSSGDSIQITDNSRDITTQTFLDSGRVFDLVSGSNGRGVLTTTSYGGLLGYTPSGSYGWLLPDIGTIILNPKALGLSPANGGISLVVDTQTNTTPIPPNPSRLFSTIQAGASFSLNSQETITSDFIFVRSRNAEFNYSTNPSFISGSTGEVLYSSFINAPQTYATTVGLYNDANELLAVAKLSRPLLKDFTKESLIRVKLDF
jgi:hypothetical protein